MSGWRVWSRLWERGQRYGEAKREFLTEHGLLYPLWYMAVGDVAMVAAIVGAVAMRHSFLHPGLPLLVGALALVPELWFSLFGLPRRLSFGACLIFHTGVMFTASALLLLRPAVVTPDTAPLIMCIPITVLAATMRARASVAAMAIAATVVVVAGLRGTLAVHDMYLIAIGFSWTLGYMLQTQMRLLQQERVAREATALQAAGEERQRIAREVHDIAGHSLAITLLHLTGARRALQHDRDIDDAVVALTDAERIGRQAMSDIRRTVGVLGSEASITSPEPGIADIDDLVADFLAAGLRVKLVIRGDLERPSPSVGLNLYRIIQESLTNVVKHAPGATAEVELCVADEAAVVLSIRNEFTGAVVKERGIGSGVRGMRQRADALGGTLSAGLGEGEWIVRAEVPLS